MQVAVLTVSDRASSGEYADETGPALNKLIEDEFPGADVVDTDVIADDRQAIASRLIQWCEQEHIDLIITNGGTGLTARDVTPEAVSDVISREIPGIGEAMRAAGRSITPLADLSRQIAGQRNTTLIVAVPGSTKAALESLTAVLPILDHAVETIHS